MDTRVNIRVYPGRAAADWPSLADRAFASFADYERRFSVFRPDSEISQVNARAGQATRISEAFAELLAYALAVADESVGAYDPLVGRWTIPARPAPASEAASYRDVEFLATDRTVRLPPGTALDLNSVVKGRAIDDALSLFGDAAGVLVEAGGDIVVRGTPAGKDDWAIAVRDPRVPRQAAIILPVASGAVCTSGDYLRGRSARLAGRVHLADARDGHVPTHYLSLTVLAPTALQADALSTAAYLLPPARAAEFVESHAACSCLLIDRLGRIFASARLNDAIMKKLGHKNACSS